MPVATVQGAEYVQRSGDISRRKLLATMGTIVPIFVTGCSDTAVYNESEGEGETIEIMVENQTEERAQIGVRVEDDDGEVLFSRVYELEPDNLDSSASIETTPSTVLVFTPEGLSATWEYAPEVEIDCDGEDIGITVHPDDMIESWYAC